jgi:hypothetical protein
MPSSQLARPFSLDKLFSDLFDQSLALESHFDLIGMILTIGLGHKVVLRK